MKRAEELAREHADELFTRLYITGTLPPDLTNAALHYAKKMYAAGIRHGYGHGREDCEKQK